MIKQLAVDEVTPLRWKEATDVAVPLDHVWVPENPVEGWKQTRLFSFEFLKHECQCCEFQGGYNSKLRPYAAVPTGFKP